MKSKARRGEALVTLGASRMIQQVRGMARCTNQGTLMAWPSVRNCNRNAAVIQAPQPRFIEHLTTF